MYYKPIGDLPYISSEQGGLMVLFLNISSGGVDPLPVAAPEAPPIDQDPAEARSLGRCCTDGHYRGHTLAIRLQVPNNVLCSQCAK